MFMRQSMSNAASLFVFWLLSMTSMALIRASREADADVVVTPKIVGGSDVEDGRYSFFVQGTYCGGSLVAEDVVLSSAYCEGFIGGHVWVGNYQYKQITDGAESRRVVSPFYIHPDYDNSTYKNDLMLFKIEPSNLTSIALNSDASKPIDDQELTTIGFGETEYNGSQPFTLQKAVMQYVPAEECFDLIGGFYLDETKLCAMDSNKAQASCIGDRGGPIFDENSDSLTLMGVTSIIWEECDPKNPVVFARVSHNLKWIYETICNLTDSSPEYCTDTPTPSIGPSPAPFVAPFISLPPFMAPSTAPSMAPSTIPSMAPSMAPSTAPFLAFTMASTSSQSKTGVIVGSVCGGIILVLALALVWMWRRKSGLSNSRHTKKPINLSQTSLSSGNQEFTGRFISPEIVCEKQDEISTMDVPTMYGFMTAPGRDDRTASVTINYDLNKQIRSSPMEVRKTSGAFEEGEEIHLNKESCSHKRIEVQAPLGKLGLVMVTPDNGIPMVHELKNDSVLANQVIVGDELISVNGTNVQRMNAQEVSHFIHLQSDQPRLLVFRRPWSNENLGEV